MKTTKSYRHLWLLPPLLVGLAAAASVIAWPHLPEQMPAHWGMSGRPDNLMPKGFAVAMLPAVMIWVGGLVGLILWSSTRGREGQAIPAWLAPASTSGVLALLLALHIAVLGFSLGLPVPVPAVANLGLGLLFMGLGRALPQVPQNPVFGVRTPRTLSDAAAWERANRAGGRALVIAGAVSILGAPLPGPWPFVITIGALLTACVMGGRAGGEEE